MLNFSFRARSVVQISTLLGVCALAAVETSSAGGTTTVYKLVAQCTDGDCEGTGVGYLTVQNYIPGQPLAYANFVSFTYASNINPIPSGITPSTQYFSSSSVLTGTMPTTLTTAAPVAVTLGWNESNLILVTSSDPGGYWCVGANDCTGDYGRGSTWVFVNSTTTAPTPAVPTLSTAAFCALGLLLAGAGALLVLRRARGSARA